MPYKGSFIFRHFVSLGRQKVWTAQKKGTPAFGNGIIV